MTTTLCNLITLDAFGSLQKTRPLRVCDLFEYCLLISLEILDMRDDDC